MPRPMTLAISAACIGVLALLVILVLSRREKAPSAPHPDESSSPLTTAASSEREPVNEKSPPRSPPAPLRRPAPKTPVKPEPIAPSAEESLAQLHELAGSNPDLSLKVAREAVRRFPDDPNAPELEWNVVKALFNLGRMDDAEAEARIMLSRYPGSSFTGDVVHHLLNHPPNPPDAP
jgi:hypothetical protein